MHVSHGPTPALLAPALLFVLAACSGAVVDPADAMAPGTPDAMPADASAPVNDAGTGVASDGGQPDASADRSDAGPSDAGASDAGLSDAGLSDAGLSDAGTSGLAPLSLLWYGASTTTFAGSTSRSSPQAGYSVPEIVADLTQKHWGRPGPAPRVWTAGGTPLSTWRARREWADASSSAFDRVITTVVRTAAPVSPAGETDALVAASADVTSSEILVWAPVQPGRTDTALGGYFACADENASRSGRGLDVAPVARAMQQARTAGFTLNNGEAFGTLNPHYTRAGAYLVAATLFAHLYGVSPVGLEPTHSYLGWCRDSANRSDTICAMSDAEAAALQAIAWDAVNAPAPRAECASFCADVSSREPVCF